IASLTEVRWLFIFYGAGFFLLSALFGLLNLHALRLRGQLALDACEIRATRREVHLDGVLAAPAAVSVLLAALLDGAWLSFAGFIYATLGISMPLAGWYHGRARAPAAAGTAAAG